MIASSTGYQEDCMNYPLAMPVLDAAFVLKAHRRCGWGLAMLDDICHEFCVGDLGLSHPLSDSMWHGTHSYIFSINN